MKTWIKVIGILFVLPLFAVIFFQFAPELENKQVREQFVKALKNNPETTDEVKAQQTSYVQSLNFVEICSGQVADSQEMIQQLQIEDVCDSLDRFAWVQMFSLILLGLGVLHLLTTWILGKAAGRSRQALISNFRLGWRLSTVFSLLILLGQTAVAVYTLYYFTTLLTGRYYPKLLLMIIIGGGWAFFKVAQMIVSHIPIESNESAAEAVSEVQAPGLWKAVREVAMKLNTAPPDHILMGLSTAFYVTEFPVRHTAGVTLGRTLFLSEPMMREMPLDEITAIIGHEMGHFQGEDTALTRELMPMLVKSDRTMLHLSEAGLIGAPAMHAMGVFSYFFEKSINAFRRERELMADAAGASITSAKSAALALARYSYAAEIHAATLDLQVISQIPKEQAFSQIQAEVCSNDKFWNSMTEHRIPHPFDSHPPLSIRTEKLGFGMDELKDLAMQPVGSSAYNQLIGANPILEKAQKEHTELLESAQQRMALKVASSDSVESQALLQRHFPTVVMAPKRGRIWFNTGLYAFLMLFLPGLFLFVFPEILLKALCVLAIGAGIYFVLDYWRDWKDQTLTLTADSIQLKSWKEPLLFKDIKTMQLQSQNGSYTLRIFLHAKRGPLARKPIVRWARAQFAIDLTGFPPKAETVANQIFRYYSRELA